MSKPILSALLNPIIKILGSWLVSSYSSYIARTKLIGELSSLYNHHNHLLLRVLLDHDLVPGDAGAAVVPLLPSHRVGGGACHLWCTGSGDGAMEVPVIW